MKELKESTVHGRVQDIYESALQDNKLVSIIDSSLQPFEKEIMRVLFDEAGRAIYDNKFPSFWDELEQTKQPEFWEDLWQTDHSSYHINKKAFRPEHYQYHWPSHNHLHNSAIYLDLVLNTMKELASEYKVGAVTEAINDFYEEIKTEIGGFLVNYDADGIAKEISPILEDFYVWHIRPTVTMARRLARSRCDSGLDLLEDIKSVKEDISGIHQAILKSGRGFEDLAGYSKSILETMDRINIDDKYPSGSLERPYMVALYAGVHFLNSVGEKFKPDTSLTAK